MKGPLKKHRMKRCNECIHLFNKGRVFACQKSGYYIEPVKIICFHRRKVDVKN